MASSPTVARVPVLEALALQQSATTAAAPPQKPPMARPADNVHVAEAPAKIGGHPVSELFA